MQSFSRGADGYLVGNRADFQHHIQAPRLLRLHIDVGRRRLLESRRFDNDRVFAGWQFADAEKACGGCNRVARHAGVLIADRNFGSGNDAAVAV